jgi:hypothetical protein
MAAAMPSTSMPIPFSAAIVESEFSSPPLTGSPGGTGSAGRLWLGFGLAVSPFASRSLRLRSRSWWRFDCCSFSCCLSRFCSCFRCWRSSLRVGALAGSSPCIFLDS